MILDRNQQAFFALLRTGLFPVHGEGVMVLGQAKRQSRANESLFKDVDWEEVYRLAQEQSIPGVVLCGIEELRARKQELCVLKELLLQWIGEVQVIEQRNKDMNKFIVDLIEKLRENDIYTLLVKGQGIAQCYERPLWRACGDVDLYLSKDNYEKAKKLLLPIATNIEKEETRRLHLGMTVDGWAVELHGTMYTKLSRRMNSVADDVHSDLFYNGNVRSWNDNGAPVFLPSANNDVIIIFNHIINHFFLEGVGLRQICDWCRLLWVYRQEINVTLLEKRLKKMGLVTEWKAFYNLASRYLGLPDLGEGLLACDSRFDKRAHMIMAFVLESGNFGHNRDVSYRRKKYVAVVNAITLWRRIRDFARFMLIFPLDSPKFFCQYCLNRITSK